VGTFNGGEEEELYGVEKKFSGIHFSCVAPEL
jgi:hypothetical protein